MPYVGQTGGKFGERFKQHPNSKKYKRKPGQVILLMVVDGVSPGERQAVEQLVYDWFLDTVGGDKDKLSNKQRPLSRTRPEKKKIREMLKKIKACK